MQNTIRRGTEQKTETMSAVTADHDQIDTLLFGEPVDLAGRGTDRNEQPILIDADVLAHFCKLLLGVADRLLLQGGHLGGKVTGEAYGTETAIDMFDGFDDVNQSEFGAIPLGDMLRLDQDLVTFLGEIDGDEYILVAHGTVPYW